MSTSSKPLPRARWQRLVSPVALSTLLCLLLGIGISVAGTTRYQYDSLGRLVRVELPDGNMIEYDYDAAGNILETRDPILDDDGDGVPDVDDCAPNDGSVYPGAPEINDGKDNQCPGEPGHGLTDEIIGPLEFTSETQLTWPPQSGATMYEIARSPYATFASKCWKAYTPEPTLEVTQRPSTGTAYHFLVRSYMPHAGSWGADSRDIERTSVCP